MKFYLGIFAGFLAFAAIAGFFVEAQFFEIRLMDLLNAAIPIFIAYYVSDFLTRRLNRDSKKIELTLDLITHLQSRLERLYLDCLLMADGGLESRAIIRQFKDSSAELYFILAVAEKRSIKDVNLIKKFHEFKASVTDTPFGQKKKYSSSQVENIQASYQSLSQLLGQLKISFCESAEN